MFFNPSKINYTRSIILSVILLSTILFSFQWQNSFSSVDTEVIRYLALSIILICLLAIGKTNVNQTNLEIDNVDIAIALLFLWNIVVNITHNSHISLIINSLLFLILYVIIKLFYSSFSIKIIGNILSISTALILVQLFFLERIFYTFPYSSYGLLENQTILAIYLVIVGPIIFQSIESPKIRIFIALLFLSIVLLYSRTAFISLGIAIYIYVAVNYRRKLLFFTLGAFLILIICFLALKNTDSIIGRFLIWKIIFKEIEPLSLLFGNGNGYIENKVLSLQSQYFTSQRTIDEQLLAGNIHSSFNEYIRILVEQGIVGISVIIFLIYSFYKRISKNIQENKFLFIAVTAFLISCLFSYPLSSITVFVILIILISTNSINKESRCITILPVKMKYILPLTTIFLVFSIYYYSKTYTYVLRYNKLIAKNYIIYNESFFLDEIEKIYTNISYNPIVVHKYAMDLYKVGLLNESLEEALKGENMFSNLNINMLIASIYEELGDNINAEKYYKRCIHMIPKAFEPKYSLFEFYINSNQYDKALYVAKLIKDYPVKVRSESVKNVKKSASDFIIKETLK